LLDHSPRFGVFARKDHQWLPLRIGQQRQQSRVHARALPGEGEGIAYYIGNQPTRVARLERLDIVHQQTDTAIALDRRQPGTKAMAGRDPAAFAARRPGAAGNEGLEAFRQAFAAQTGYGMGHESTRG